MIARSVPPHTNIWVYSIKGSVKFDSVDFIILSPKFDLDKKYIEELRNKYYDAEKAKKYFNEQS